MHMQIEIAPGRAMAERDWGARPPNMIEQSRGGFAPCQAESRTPAAWHAAGRVAFMKRSRVVPALPWIIFAAVLCPSAEAQKAVILVRHAEKAADGSKDPALTPAGGDRARRLARIVKEAGVTAVYTSEFRRTIQTAEPAAEALKRTAEVVPAKDTAGLAAKIRARGPEDVVLVVGHSNTLPEILKALGHAAEVAIGDDDYENLFVLVPKGEGPPAVVRLRY